MAENEAENSDHENSEDEEDEDNEEDEGPYVPFDPPCKRLNTYLFIYSLCQIPSLLPFFQKLKHPDIWEMCFCYCGLLSDHFSFRYLR